MIAASSMMASAASLPVVAGGVPRNEPCAAPMPVDTADADSPVATPSRPDFGAMLATRRAATLTSQPTILPPTGGAPSLTPAALDTPKKGDADDGTADDAAAGQATPILQLADMTIGLVPVQLSPQPQPVITPVDDEARSPRSDAAAVPGVIGSPADSAPASRPVSRLTDGEPGRPDGPPAEFASERDGPDQMPGAAWLSPLAQAGGSSTAASPHGAAATSHAIGFATPAQQLPIDDGGAWIDRLAGDIAAMRAPGGVLRFHLSPDTLGPVAVAMRHGDDGCGITITTDTVRACALMTDARDRLLDQLRVTGMGAASIDVEVGQPPQHGGRFQPPPPPRQIAAPSPSPDSQLPPAIVPTPPFNARNRASTRFA